MNILHIDRSTFFQKLVQRSTEAGIAGLSSCTSIAEAHNILLSEQIDLILSGQELEDGSASDFLKQKSDTPYQHVPVIMLTANDSLEARETYFKLGVVDFISKSDFSHKKQLEYIEHFIEKDNLTASMQNASIAVVDDSRFSINVIRSILELHRIQNLESFNDPQELIDSGKEYDIYFIDMVLPKISGKQLVMRIRREHPHAVIIIISALEDFNTIAHALDAGADDYLTKPFDARLMMARLRTNFRSFIVMKELEKQREFQKEMAITDSLTGAKNRRYVFDQLEREIHRTKRHKHPLSMLLLDIDYFKKINDQYGHFTGDNILKSISEMFKRECRNTDIFGRYGGEEFILVMPDTPLDAATQTSDRLRQVFSEMKFTEKDSNFRVTFSGGVCQWKDETVEELLKKADKLLYQAKEAGRNNIRG